MAGIVYIGVGAALAWLQPRVVYVGPYRLLGVTPGEALLTGRQAAPAMGRSQVGQPAVPEAPLAGMIHTSG